MEIGVKGVSIFGNGDPRQTLKITPQSYFIADGIEVHCDKPGARIYEIIFAAKSVWRSEEGVSLEELKNSNYFQRKVHNQSVNAGLTIFVTAFIPETSTLTVLITAKRRPKRG